jgi:hypothetical protein
MKYYSIHSARVQPATIAILSFTYCVTAVMALYFLNPSYNLLSSVFGNYQLTPYEFLIASTFFSLGLGSLALAIGLYQGMSRSVRSLTGLIFLGIWGIGMLLAGIFPTNAGGSTVPHLTTVLLAGIFPVEVQATPETEFSLLHIFAILGALFSLALAAILLAWQFKQDEKRHLLYFLALILALLMFSALVLFFSVILFPSLLGYTNYTPGIFIVIGFVAGFIWLLLTTACLRFMVNGTVPK